MEKGDEASAALEDGVLGRAEVEASARLGCIRICNEVTEFARALAWTASKSKPVRQALDEAWLEADFALTITNRAFDAVGTHGSELYTPWSWHVQLVGSFGRHLQEVLVRF